MEGTPDMKPETKMKLKAWWSKHLLKFLYGTCRWDVQGQEQIRTLVASGKTVIIAIWHGKVLPIFMNLASKHYYALAGMHRDAELIAQMVLRLDGNYYAGQALTGEKRCSKKLFQFYPHRGRLSP